MPGYASLMVVVLLLGGINMLTLGVMGEYIGRIYTEAKGRPLYLVRESYGFDENRPAEPEPGPTEKGTEPWNAESTAEWRRSKTGTGGS